MKLLIDPNFLRKTAGQWSGSDHRRQHPTHGCQAGRGAGPGDSVGMETEQAFAYGWGRGSGLTQVASPPRTEKASCPPPSPLAQWGRRQVDFMYSRHFSRPANWRPPLRSTI